MAEMYVTCPDCEVRVRLADTDGGLIDYQDTCGHNMHPTKCPVLGAPIAAIQQALKQGSRIAAGTSSPFDLRSG
jgi:hypothetical protein